MDLATFLAFFSALFASGMALAIAFSERRSIPHWFFVVGMAAFAIEGIFAGLTANAELQARMVYWQNWRLLVLSFLPGTWLVFSVIYARGNYLEFLRKWRFALAAAFLVPVGVATLFRHELITSIGQKEAGGHWIIGLGTPGLILNLFFLLSAVLVLMNLERTFRASVGTMRWRIKFTIIGLGVLFAVRAYTSSQALLFRGFDLSLVAVNSGALIVACVLILRSLSRAGAADVTVYPSKSVLHTSFTILLAGSYLLIVGVFAKVVTFLGGDAAFQLKAFLVLVSLVLLAILLLSDRVRLQTKRFVSRHFQRPQYDYRKVWRTFTEGTTLRVQESDLCRAVVKLVSDLFQVLSVTIWLVDGKKENLAFATSTSLAESKGKEFANQDADVGELIRALRNNPDPIDIDATQEKWAAILRKCHPAEFREGGHRVCLPLIAGGELLGIMIVGDRVGAVPFSTQDFDLLKCVGDQAAASLLNLQLSQRLLQAREMEAFQTMSAFFVHDLKNTASTLSLMLQNLPAHFNDPAFREDALRGVARSVDHINDLIRRLTLLRQGTASGLVESDLNELVADAVGSLEQGHGVDVGGQQSKVRLQVVKDLRPLPKQRLDPEQIKKVVTNLVLNAKEAANGGGGEIRIETGLENNWTVLSVTDNGCGMAQEFVERSLFRPFQTTKKQGIGIGMFQSKTIVEAHHGKIEVQSELGKGTTFRVLLPIDPLKLSTPS